MANSPEGPDSSQPSNSRPPRFVQNFESMREDLSVHRLAEVSRASQRLPNILQGDTVPTPANGQLVIGEIYPEKLVVGRRGSSLLGALAIATNAVNHNESSREIFESLSSYNSQTVGSTDSPRH